VTVAVRRVARVAVRALTVWVALVAASIPAFGGTLPAGAEVAAGRSVDLASFAWQVATRYDVQFDHVIATDLDRDGDQDVVGAGSPGLVVWLNDGAGHLTSQPPRESTGVEMRAPATEWNERGSFNLPTDRGSVAPARTARPLTHVSAVPPAAAPARTRASRAPPSLR
jgi:hypothetical protein